MNDGISVIVKRIGLRKYDVAVILLNKFLIVQISVIQLIEI